MLFLLLFQRYANNIAHGCKLSTSFFYFRFNHRPSHDVFQISTAPRAVLDGVIAYPIRVCKSKLASVKTYYVVRTSKILMDRTRTVDMPSEGFTATFDDEFPHMLIPN